MAKLTYADLLLDDRNPYAALYKRNTQIANTPETVPSYAPFATPVTPGSPSPYQRDMTAGYAALAKVPGVGGGAGTGTTDKAAADRAAWETAYGSPTVSQEEYDRLHGVERDRAAWNEQNGVVSGYADYARMQGVPEAQAAARAEYERSRSTYGVLAEKMAQAGIHGGYGDYLDAQAYATMQNQRFAADQAARKSYADYILGKDAEYNKQISEANTGYAQYAYGVKEANDAAYKQYQAENEAKIGSLYGLLTSGGTDADGNPVQGAGLDTIQDAKEYESQKNVKRQELVNRGYTEQQVDEAFARVEQTRKAETERMKDAAQSAIEAYNDRNSSQTELLKSFGYELSEGEKEDDAVLSALEDAEKRGYITPEQRSKAYKVGLSIYGESPSAKDVLKSVKTAIDYADEKLMTSADKNDVLDDALNAVATGLKKHRWIVKIEDGKIYAKDDRGSWIDLGNIPAIHDFRRSLGYYKDVVDLVYKNRT